MSAIGPAVKRYVSKLGNPELSIVFGDKLTGPIFKQIDDAYLNGKKVLIVYANGFVKQHLDYTGNYGISVNLIYTAFTIIVPLNRLDIVKC